MELVAVTVVKEVHWWYSGKPFIYKPQARVSNKHLFVCVYLDGWIYWYGGGCSVLVVRWWLKWLYCRGGGSVVVVAVLW